MHRTLKIPIALIVAVAKNGVIGRDNQLPWRLPADLKHFKATTLGKPIVMGRKTFASLGRPLPGRANIVVTRDRNFRAEGVVVVGSLDDALQRADAIAARDGIGEIMVIGGAEIYRQALPLAQKLYYTEVETAPDGDAYFDAIDWSQWECVEERRFAAVDELPAYRLSTYRRIAEAGSL